MEDGSNVTLDVIKILQSVHGIRQARKRTLCALLSVYTDGRTKH